MDASSSLRRPRATRVAFFDVGIPTRPPCLNFFSLSRILASSRAAPRPRASHDTVTPDGDGRDGPDTATTSHTVLKVQGESTTRARTSDFDPRR